MHDLARLHRIFLVNRDDTAVVEHAFERHVDVDDFRHHLLHERQEDALRRLCEIAVLHRRLANNRRRINRMFAVRDAGDVEHGIIIGERIIARMVTERPFAAHLVRAHIALEHDFRARRHLEIDRLALHHLDGLVPQEAREHHLVDVAWQRCRRGIRQHGVGADGHGRLDLLAARRLRVAEIVRAVLVDVPVHARRAFVVFLQAVHADIALARRRILREDERQRDERPAVLRPARQNRNLVEVRLHLHDFLARRFFHVLRKVDGLLRHRDQRDDIHLVLKRNIRKFHDLAQLVADIIELLHTKRERHALIAAERIHEHRHVVALHVFEQKSDVCLALHLRHAVRNLRDLKMAVHGLRDTPQQPALLQHRDELAQIFICQRILPPITMKSNTYYYTGRGRKSQ